MSNKESTTGGNSTSNPPSNPPPTGKQVRQMCKSRKSQKKVILETAQRDGSISSEQMKAMGFYSGNKRISELKEDGHIFIKTQDWKRNGLATYHYLGHKGDANE
ncbi:helix-turn-helix domain-containing protein [Marinicella rhabdoformis]|uniref:helix-turn-helix domain-containing protein n=1 Tax=Marinicella rhabdoformis TaxID=2580566 RepID=UPI0012AED708|nr:helix-turn-helix domain-containing protein [Marinicella rhabdoformis]